MEPNVKDVLDKMQNWGVEHDAREVEHRNKMLNLEPDTARLLDILVRSGGYRNLLEIGTSSGYSTIWLASAARDVSGARLVSLEINPAKLELAEGNLREAGLRGGVELRQGAANELLLEMTEIFDFVFLDADRRLYSDLLPLLIPRLRPRAMLCADNALSHPQEIAPYLERIARLPDFESIVVHVGKGLSIAYRAG